MSENKTALITQLSESYIRVGGTDRYAMSNNEGVASAKQNNFSSALKSFDEAIRQDPDSKEAYYNRGIAKIQSGFFDIVGSFDLSEDSLVSDDGFDKLRYLAKILNTFL